MPSKREQQEAAGRWLRTTRERRGFSTGDAFARRVGVSGSLLSRYETGLTGVPDDKAEKIAEVLGLEIIAVRRGLGLWVPPRASDDELRDAPADDDGLQDLVDRARRERDAGDDTLYRMLLRLQGMGEPQRDSDARDRNSDGNQRAGEVDVN